MSSYLREQCTVVIRGELLLRTRSDAELVHDTRVGLRRLRSALRSFAPLLTPDAAELEVLEEDLRWLAALLSDLRDADVLGERLTARLAALPADLVLGGPLRDDVTHEVRQALAGVRHRSYEVWQAQRTTDRFRRTMRAVARWYDRPPVAGEPLSDKALRRAGRELLDVAERRARRRLADADRVGANDPAAPELAHRARKAFKRLRYTAEVLEPVLPRAVELARRAKKQQRRLGSHQDLVVEAAFLRHCATVLPTVEAHHGFVYGLMLAHAEHEAARLRERA
ncbi:CHAD domain-containing protein [Nocardioides mangrovicus]|uniref:CHAD domain-containing protein n=1 Tax=Nocardioides mangrovicus TaxID=2478913 RepID=UPI0013140DF9|nr:CHAD domain-containing protein [Nocardioides mangrovicus]